MNKLSGTELYILKIAVQDKKWKIRHCEHHGVFGERDIQPELCYSCRQTSKELDLEQSIAQKKAVYKLNN